MSSKKRIFATITVFLPAILGVAGALGYFWYQQTLEERAFPEASAPSPALLPTEDGSESILPLASEVRQSPFSDPQVQPATFFETKSVSAPVGSDAVATNTVTEDIRQSRPSRAGIDPDHPFDVIAANGKIFEGWEKPEVTLVFTGRLNGYMEPCGCAGMERMMGGLSRRASFFESLVEKGWDPVLLDIGGISPGFTRQAQLKFLSTVSMLREMDYDAITFGNIDLNFPAGDLLSEVSNPGHSGTLFSSANVGIFAFDQSGLKRAKIISRNGISIGVIGVLGDEEQKEVKNDEIAFAPAKAMLQRYVPTLARNCNFVVLLSHASVEESREYAKSFPQVDIVVSAGGPPVSPSEVEIIPETGQYFITIGEKGMHAMVLGLYDDEKTPVRYQRVPMDSRFPSSSKILDLMGLYQSQLAMEGLEGLGIRPIDNPYAQTNGKFVGSARCESCHEESYNIWKKSRHAKAWKSLEESTPSRVADPECIACHVVGWTPDFKMPLDSGFLSEKETPHLTRVGCESCHGPGERHISAELGKDEALQAKYRLATRLSVDDAKKTFCVRCHDLDNSPAFNFDTYWPVVEHSESAEE